MIAGDEESFREIVRAYRNYVFQIVFSVVRHPKDAEDVMQEVFLKMFTSLPHTEVKGLKAWLSRVAVNKAIDYKRKAYRQREMATDGMEETMPPPSMLRSDTEDPLIHKEFRELVMRKLNELPENYRDVLIAFYYEDKSYQQIADEQEVTVQTIKSKLYRAKQWIKQHWKEEEFK
ncbi:MULTISPECIES: RNA polymerase sigma factor [Paenibacillus]|uniref:Sigma-70 family RNA polymerase sigma factor n=1 Tax=Paenibacillus lutrae TaxID=2078573 RepID=A0A7X3K1U9_9BACL|nr:MULTISPECIES: sigma-70 family RNA polymerase sigma factor [Paenibacillus]MVP02482.1 sigma-70 family RNA polymerase sigma factor [Paenibacillus lutrae]